MKHIKNIALILATTLTFSTSCLWARDEDQSSTSSLLTQNETQYSDENNINTSKQPEIISGQNEIQYSDENSDILRSKHLKLEIEKLDQQIKKEYERYEQLKNSNPDEAKKCELKMYEFFVELSKLEEELEKLEKTHKNL